MVKVLLVFEVWEVTMVPAGTSKNRFRFSMTSSSVSPSARVKYVLPAKAWETQRIWRKRMLIDPTGRGDFWVVVSGK